MLKLDNSLLDELGLGTLPADQKRPMLQHIYDTLELRVGTTLANQMTDQQLDEFERFIENGGDADQAQALQWLEANLPNYKQVVNDVFEALKAEIRQMAPQILAASFQQQQQQQPPVQDNVTSQNMALSAAAPQPGAQDYGQPAQPPAAYGQQPNTADGGGAPGELQIQHNQPMPMQRPPAGPGGYNQQPY